MLAVLNGNLKNLSREREVHMAYYTQLTQEERYHISVLCKERFPKAEIARGDSIVIQVLIIRELKRNTGKRGYRAKQAQQKALYRRYTAEKSIKLTHRIIRLIVTRLNDKWSPEQISGWLKRMQIHISHERIYQFLLENKRKEEYCINTCVVPTESERNVMSAQNDEDRYLIGYLLMIVLE